MTAADSTPRPTCLLPPGRVIDRYFLEHRAKLIDIAAFLDRVDRASGPDNPADDYRLRRMRGAIALLIDGKAHRARRILEHFSDPSTDPIAAASGKGAAGAYDPEAPA